MLNMSTECFTYLTCYPEPCSNRASADIPFLVELGVRVQMIKMFYIIRDTPKEGNGY